MIWLVEQLRHRTRFLCLVCCWCYAGTIVLRSTGRSTVPAYKTTYVIVIGGLESSQMVLTRPLVWRGSTVLQKKYWRETRRRRTEGQRGNQGSLPVQLSGGYRYGKFWIHQKSRISLHVFRRSRKFDRSCRIILKHCCQIRSCMVMIIFLLTLHKVDVLAQKIYACIIFLGLLIFFAAIKTNPTLVLQWTNRYTQHLKKNTQQNNKKSY